MQLKKQNQRIDLFGLPLYLNSEFKRQPFTHSSQKKKSYKSISQDVMLLHFWTGQQLIIVAALQIMEKSFVSLTATIAMIYLPPPNNSPALCQRPKEPAS